MASKLRRGEAVEVMIEALDGKGNGIARVGDYTVGVRGGVPGDRTLARIRRVRRYGQAEARAEEILDGGVPRVAPRCAHFGICGGCLWQDIAYEEQVRLKQGMVAQCLETAGIDVALDSPLAAENAFFYRNKMEFSFGMSHDKGVNLGLHVDGRFDRIFDLERCHLQSDVSNRVVDRIRQFARKQGLSVYHLRRHEGLLRFLTVREGKQTGEVMVILTTSGEDMPDVERLGTELTLAFPEIRSVIHSVNRRKAQVAIGDEERIIAGSATVQETLSGFSFEISPSSFFQTNTLQAERMYRRVVELVAPCSGDRVLDVYCGTGGISLCLAEQAGHVVGVEVSEGAVRDAVRNSANNQVTNCQFVAGAAEQVLWQLKAQGERFAAAVADPPRAGMHPKALQALADLQPERIVYVSCNPQAFAADLKRFSDAGYHTDYAQLVDMFPHTPHCEALARLAFRG